MGLAASQARLLSLTARQHTVEHRAQYLQAQKLRLANDSDRVYEKYINALDATQIETRAYDKEGKVHWLEGSYNNLMRYTADDKSAGNVYYVQDIDDGKLYMPQEVCKAYEGAGGDLFNFLDAMNIRYTKDVHTDEYIAAQQVVENDIKKGWNIKPYDTDFTSEYTYLKSLVSDPPESELYNAANVLFSIAAYTQNSVSGVYLPSNTSYLTELRTNINTLKGTSYYNGNVQTILDYISSFDISAIFANPDSVDTLSAITQPAQDVYIYYEKDQNTVKRINLYTNDDMFFCNIDGPCYISADDNYLYFDNQQAMFIDACITDRKITVIDKRTGKFIASVIPKNKDDECLFGGNDFIFFKEITNEGLQKYYSIDKTKITQNKIDYIDMS